MWLQLFTIFSFCFSLGTSLSVVTARNNDAVKFVQDVERAYTPYYHEIMTVMWKYSTNITKHNSKEQVKAWVEYDDRMLKLRNEAAKIDLTHTDADTKRKMKTYLTTMTSTNQTITQRSSEVATEMTTIYSTGSVPYKEDIVKSIEVKDGLTKLRLGKHLKGIMADSNDPDELLYVWKAWRDDVGRKEKKLYEEFISLNNIGAREHGYKDAGEYKRQAYEVDDLEKIAENFLSEMRPFYLELHAYVRYKLSKVYPKHVTANGLIPAHLLGNMWAQNWINTFRHVAPYPGAKSPDYTKLIKEKLNVNRMFKMAEEFFMSLGWPALPSNFWKKSMFVEPKDRKVECHASAWDFQDKYNGEPDVRVKMCTKLTQTDFNTVHHELGHIYYYLLYWNQPLSYRTGANPGFHEAVGDVMSLSVQTPSHLKKVGLLDTVPKTKEADINFLLRTALQRIAFLPFAFLMDKWVWNVYNGKITPDQYNTKWWEYRRKYQGIKSPIPRTENDFDPGAKSHIPNNVPYIRYFFSYILQFTFHKQACKLAGNTGPLHQYSIYNSKEAGKALGDMLALGSSKPWPEVLKQFTGSEKISTEPIKEYFKPLITWLTNYRKEKKYVLDWDDNEA